METMQVASLRRTLAFSLNVLVAVSKGDWAVKFCSNKNSAVLNWGCQLSQVVVYNGCKMVVIVQSKGLLLLPFYDRFAFGLQRCC